jgi:hypothetical protein
LHCPQFRPYYNFIFWLNVIPVALLTLSALLQLYILAKGHSCCTAHPLCLTAIICLSYKSFLLHFPPFLPYCNLSYTSFLFHCPPVQPYCNFIQYNISYSSFLFHCPPFLVTTLLQLYILAKRQSWSTTTLPTLLKPHSLATRNFSPTVHPSCLTATTFLGLNHLPLSPWLSLGHSEFYRNSRRNSQIKVHHWCQGHRWQMKKFFKPNVFYVFCHYWVSVYI